MSRQCYARKAGFESLSLPEKKSVQGSEEGGGVSGRHNGGEERGRAEPQPEHVPSVSRPSKSAREEKAEGRRTRFVALVRNHERPAAMATSSESRPRPEGVP